MSAEVRVVFVAPFFLETTVRFVRAVAELPNVKLGLISQDPLEKLDPRVKARLSAHWQVGNSLDAHQIAGATRELAARLGGVDRLLGTLEQLQIPLAMARELAGVPGISVDVARNFREKARMKERLRAAGLPCARHRLVESVEDAVDFGRAVGYPLVVKPPAGAGSVDTSQARDEGELRTLVARMQPSSGRGVLCEEFIGGLERSFEVVSIGGKRLWHSLTRYAPPPLDVLENPWIQWTVLLPREIDGPEFAAIRDAGPRALEVLGMDTGITHMEWFRRQDGTVAISEVAARPPGAQFTTLLSYAHDVDFYRAWVRLVGMDRFEVPQRRFATGAAFLRGQGDGR
ncbi:MAG: ATP-grasp domain-containing protein, partial [Myxococcales bacterium]|nr:ATP-grasp domain-containing protein [Myxococcales bacterium]